MSNLAFLFPGQGAQVVGMGRDFFEAFASVRARFEEAEECLKRGLKELIFQGPMQELTETRNSQIAIYLVSFALCEVFRQQLGVKPAVVAGLSLGEYTALAASKHLSFLEGLKLVAQRGAFMQEACEKSQGTMRVVLGLDPESVKFALPENVWIANLNCPGQVVIAGLSSAMPAAEEALKAKGAKRVLGLEVSGAFHTPLMRVAGENLKPYLLAAPLHPGESALVMNVPGDYVKDLDAIRQNLCLQVSSPTLWQKGILAMEADSYIEIGPGKSLSGMNRKIGVKGPCHSIEKVEDLEAYAAVQG